jgi:hypothetical protein
MKTLASSTSEEDRNLETEALNMVSQLIQLVN